MATDIVCENEDCDFNWFKLQKHELVQDTDVKPHWLARPDCPRCGEDTLQDLVPYCPDCERQGEDACICGDIDKQVELADRLVEQYSVTDEEKERMRRSLMMQAKQKMREEDPVAVGDRLLKRFDEDRIAYNVLHTYEEEYC